MPRDSDERAAPELRPPPKKNKQTILSSNRSNWLKDQVPNVNQPDANEVGVNLTVDMGGPYLGGNCTDIRNWDADLPRLGKVGAYGDHPFGLEGY